MSDPRFQVWFDMAHAGIVAQGGPATDTGIGCMYRAPNGRKCAMGHLIPDGLYVSGMEANTASSVIRRHPKVEEHLGGCTAEVLNFLDRLQTCHDRAVLLSKFNKGGETLVNASKFFEAYNDAMAKLAREYELVFNPVEK